MIVIVADVGTVITSLASKNTTVKTTVLPEVTLNGMFSGIARGAMK